jgi:hypothetical protein
LPCLASAQRVKRRAGNSNQQTGQEDILHDHDRAARLFGGRRDLVDLSGGGRGKNHNHQQ